MHIVIGGAGELSCRLAEALMEQHEVVLVLPDKVVTARVDDLDVHTVRGEQSSTGILRKAGTDKADFFIACGENNEQNLVACVAASRLGAARTICFLLRRDFSSTVEDDVALAESLGINALVRPSTLLADEIARIVTVPGALDVEAFVGGQVRLLRHAIETGAKILAGSLREIKLPEGVVLVMGRRGDAMFIPGGDTRFEAGDKLTAMGTPEGINRLLYRYLRSRDHGRDPRTATVVGGGMVGVGVARGLEASGWTVKLIESNQARCEVIAPLIRGLVLLGDGSDLHLMEDEQVGSESVLVAVTSNDEKNLLISLLARHLGVPRIVTRADLPANERLFERVGVDVVRSATGAAIRAVVRWVVSSRKELLAELEHGDAQVLELELPAALTPVQLLALKRPVFAIVGAILRAGKVIIPRGNDTLQGGDHVLVFCTKKDEAQTRKYFLSEILERQE